MPDDWRVLSVRITTFVSPDTLLPPSLWQDLFSTDPEQTTFQRSLAAKSESGDFAAGVLVLQSQPNRLDWVYAPSAALGLIAGRPVDLGAFPEAVTPFSELFRKWTGGKGLAKVNRIALGIEVGKAVDSREAGYTDLSRFVDGVPDPVEVRDFLVQMNRPRPSLVALPGTIINRLAKWSVAQLRILRFGGSGSLGPPDHGVAACQVRVELDINTDADFAGVIPQGQLESVFEELLAGAAETLRPRTPQE